MKKIFTLAIISIMLIAFGGKEAAAVGPQASFVDPTPADGATITDTSVEIEASIIEAALADVTFNWDGTDYVLYDDSLVLMFNFDNVAALGEDYEVYPEYGVADLSGQGNDGVLSDTPGIPAWIAGKYGGAFDFTGNGVDSGQSILVPHSDSLNPGSGDFAIAVWILTKDDYDGDVLRKGSTGTASTWYKVEHAPGGDADTLSLNFNTDGTDATITSTQVYNDYQWHFVVAQRNGSQAQLWIDGVLDGSASISGSISNTANLAVGSKDTQNDDFINSALDEVRIYMRSFNQNEIQELYCSNLSKYEIDKWTLYVNQSDLTDGTYTYQASATNSAIPAETSSTEQRTLTVVAQAEPKNVIFFIGDGMGPEQVKAGGMYANGAAGTLCFEGFPYAGELTTYSANNPVTDSAAAATALATGVKVNNDVISMAYPGDGSELETLLERFKAQGKSTGLVTTTYMAHATPAAFGAHEPARGNYTQIADDYLTQTRPNVIYGGASYMGGAVGEGYTVVTNRAEMLAYYDAAPETMLSGQFDPGDMPYEADYDYDTGTIPRLSDMTDAALSILDNDADGFFLMVEGGNIDYACHDHADKFADEVVEFANAVQEAIDWAAGRTDTLIIVCADHETGGLTVTGNNGAGNYPSVTWSSTGHTAANVPVYAWGENAELISGVMDNTDMFDVVVSDAPIQLVSPVYDAVDVSTSPTLEVTVYDPDGSEDVDVAFYGREAAFTIVVLPDTQGYSQSYPEIFDSQTQWIVDSADALNTVFVTHVGDIVENYDDVEQEWINANNSMSILDGKVPYGLLPGNHDKPTGYYNQYFSYTRYEGLAWYGGHYPETGNDNNYQLFSAGGEDYIILHIEFCPGSDVLDWGNWILQQYPERKAIIVTHGFINEFGERTVSYCDTQYIWDALVLPNDNVWFVLCGHNGSVGEALRTDFVTDHDVYQLLSCYQRRSNGGDGWLRIMQFVPAEDTVYVYTYSPWLDQYETDGNSEFTLNFPMSGSDFSAIGTNTGVPSGSNASVEWSGLATGTQYEWYVTVTESSGTTAGPVWNFTTGGNQAPLAVDDDIYSVDEDTLTPLDVEAPGVLGNDTDAENDPLTAILVDDVTNGTLTLNSDGSFTYTPNANFSGTDMFTYVADDGISSSNIATVTITVNNVDDDPPVAVDDTPTADEDVPVNIDVLGNDSDPDGDTLSILSVTVPDQGGAVVNNGTDVTYTPASDFYGVETFSYTVTDGTAGDERSATVTVTVNSINDDPVANDDTTATDEDTAVTINVLENDTDVDTGDTLTVTSVTQPGNGAVINNGTDVTYTPNADFFGSDSFTYTVGDGNGGSATGTVNVTVNSINDPPAAPQNLSATAGPSVVNLDWDDNVEQEGDLAGYNIYRSQTSGSYDFGSPLANVTVSAYTDNTVVNDTTYYYVVKAVDNVGLESTAASNEVSATPAETAYDAYVNQEPIVTFGEVVGTIQGTIEAGDGLVQTITEVSNGRAGMASLEAEYLLHTTASPAEVTGLTLYLDATWTALDGTADPLLTNIMVWNGTSGWEDITGDIGDGSFVAPDPQKCIDGDGNIRLLFTDTTAVKKEKKDTLTIDLLYAHISAGPVDNPPVVTITSPSDGATFGSGVVISFVGTAIDAEDGDLTSGLVWQSDIDGQIGTGGSFTTTLNDGEHAITTSVTDSGSNIGSASISITVGDPPPAPPTGLAASAGDGQVSLDWDDNAEPDVVGYNVYRSETSGGSYSQVNGTLLATSDYLDLGVINGTTYYYVVTAVDSATPIPNESGNSDEVSATPDSFQAVSVLSIDMAVVSGKKFYATATIAITPGLDGATVIGDWYLKGVLRTIGATALTNGSGIAVFTSFETPAKAGDTFMFVVTDVVASGYIYDESSNVETSDSILVP